MRYCAQCGIPLQYGRFLRWTPDGTIVGRDVARTRLAFIEVDEVRCLVSGASERFRMNVEPVVYRAEKEVGRRFASTLLPRFMTLVPRTRLTRPAFLTRMIGRIIFRYMAGLGMGRAGLLGYRSGREALFRVTDIHSVPLVAGDAAGVFEHLERVGADASWEEERDGVVIRLRKVSDEPAAETRLAFEKPEYIPGAAKLDHCTVCGVPREVTDNLRWDLAGGTIRNTTTGAREVALASQSFYSVLRELERELGDEVPAAVVELEQEYIRESSALRHYAGGRDDPLSLLSDFNWRGVGNPVSVKNVSGGYQVVVENPFHPWIVAGRVAGLFEAWKEARFRTSWEERPGHLRVTLGKVAG